MSARSKAVTPTPWVALLRGINLGRTRKVAMPELRDVVVAAGYPDARTWIQSGNVLFTSSCGDRDVMAAELERSIEARFGFEVGVLLRSRDELARVVEENPLPDAVADPARFYAIFLSAQPARDVVRELRSRAFERDEWALGDRVIYAWYRDGLHASRLAGAVSDRRLGVTTTARNWNTTTKLLELASSGT